MSERPRVLSLYLCVCLVKVGTTKKLDLYFQRTFLNIQNPIKIFKIKPFQGLRHQYFSSYFDAVSLTRFKQLNQNTAGYILNKNSEMASWTA